MKPKQNHCYGHTPQIQKGAKTSNSGVKRMPFVTIINNNINNNNNNSSTKIPTTTAANKKKTNKQAKSITVIL